MAASSCRVSGLAFRRAPATGATQRVQWTPDTAAAAVEHVGIDHRGADVGVAQEFLDGADVVAPFQQVGREGMTEGVACGGLAIPAPRTARFTALLEHGFMEVVATPPHPRYGVVVAAASPGTPIAKPNRVGRHGDTSARVR